MSNLDYWKECVSIAIDECGLIATQEQIDYIADCVDGGHENYGMAHGHDCIPNPLIEENDRLKRELQKEKEKTVCKNCGGSGWITINGPCHSSTSKCTRCRGEGKV